MPSALVLSDLLVGRVGDPPIEALERAGFDRNQLDGYLKRRAAHMARCTAPTCRGN